MFLNGHNRSFVHVADIHRGGQIILDDRVFLK